MLTVVLPGTGTWLPGQRCCMDPEPSAPQGLRVVVLYNQDFLREDMASLPSAVSRADVAKTAQQVARALAARGHFAQSFGLDIEDLPDWMARLGDDPPDLVFNLCESLRNDDRQERVIPTLLDAMEIPYTGTDPFFLELALHKDRTHRWLSEAGVLTPKWTVVQENEDPRGVLAWRGRVGLPYPLIVKPSRENASVGIEQASVVYDDASLVERVSYVQKTFRQSVVVEQYVAGREVNVSFLSSHGEGLLPLHEIDFSQLPPQHAHVVGYDGKWDTGSAEYAQTMPRPVQDMSATVTARVQDAARRVFSVMMIRDYGRCDLRVSPSGDVFVIDVNPNCDLSQEAGYAKAALAGGLSYEMLIERIALSAAQRGNHESTRAGTHQQTANDPRSRSHAQRQSAPVSVAGETASVLGG